MSLKDRRLTAAARGACTTCASRPSLPDRLLCQACTRRSRYQAEIRSYRILSVPGHTYRSLTSIATARGTTITGAVDFVLAGFAEALSSDALACAQPHATPVPAPTPHPTRKRAHSATGSQP